ncbi:MAG TPA: hypothetical protein DCZ07_13830 [Alphaproteobacteria bacterium]|jgi:hypothetical protein|nr:hypothetical protein [Alphaproteobacteria bacterium]
MIEKETFGRRQQAIEQFRRSAGSPELFGKSQQLADYWFNLKKSGLLPEKKTINPRDLQSLLPQIVMLERDEAGLFKVRLSGTGITELWGIEPTGKEFLAHAALQNRDKVQSLLQSALQQPCGLIMRYDDLYTDGRLIQTEFALFPIRMSANQTQILFGVISAADHEEQSWPQPLLATAFYRIKNFQFVSVGGGTPTPTDDC